MSSGISPISSQTTTLPLTTTATNASSTTGLANESTFLTLLVTQLKNQDPLSPADSTQFVTQLAQFSQLEDLQNINQNVMNISTDITAEGAPASPTASTSNPTVTT
jgi:flagellar basal-body rod modification protein FlgD